MYPQAAKPFILYPDMSNKSVEDALSQEIYGQEDVIICWNECLSKRERNYCTIRQE